MTRHSPYVIKLSAADRAVLEQRSRTYTARHTDVVRAKIVLLAADGHQNTAIAARLDVHVNVVRTWRKRFFEAGLDGLADRPRPGRARSFPAEVVAEVNSMGCESPEQREVPLSRWSSAEPAAQGVAEGLVLSVTGPGAVIGANRARARRLARRWRRPSSTASAPAGQLITFEPRYNATATLDALRRLASSINRYLGDEDADAGAAGDVDGGPLQAESARPLGAVWLLDQLWKLLGIDTTLTGVIGGHRFRTDVERALFALVANRAIAPASKLAAGEWVTHNAAVPGFDAMDGNQALRAMDLLTEADTEGAVQEAVFLAATHLLNLEVDVIFFDTTSTYFKRDGEHDPGGTSPDGQDQVEGRTGGLRRFGPSKDHRRDLPQIVIGLAVTREGIPVRCWVGPGNTTDTTVLTKVKDDLRSWRLGRVVTVADPGSSSEASLPYLRCAGSYYITGVKIRQTSATAAQALARQGRYQQIRDNLRIKEVRLGPGLDRDPGRRWIICHNPVKADRDAARRADQLDAISTELERIAAARAADADTAAKKAPRTGTRVTAPSEALHRKAECALCDHPTLGRWLKQHPTTGRLSIDRAKVAAEARLDGKYLLTTSDPNLPAEDAALGYTNLLEAERSFRTMKSTLYLRPVYHRLDQRIRAHALLCWLALLLIRVAECRTGATWRTIATELGRIHQVTLAGPAGRQQQTTRLTDTQIRLLTDAGVPPPPKMTGLQPAE